MVVQVSFPPAERDRGAALRLVAIGRPAENRMLVFISLLVELEYWRDNIADVSNVVKGFL